MTSSSQLRAWRIRICAVTGASLLTSGAVFAADLGLKDAPVPTPAAYDWTGFYAGTHLGYAFGDSNWAATDWATGAPIGSGSLSFTQHLDTFRESGSFFGGIQTGYNYQLGSGFVIGAEADASFPSFQTPDGISVGGYKNMISPIPGEGSQTYSDTLLWSGTVRGRIGYAPAAWPGTLLYATGGFAWGYDQVTLTQATSGLSETTEQFRTGYAVGGGVEAALFPHWTGRIEYLYKDYGKSDAVFPEQGQRFNSDLSLSEVRVGLNYRFNDDNQEGSTKDPKVPYSFLNSDDVSFHGQFTATVQGYPSFSSAFYGPNSLFSGGQGREVMDLTLYAGFRLWKGAELWIDPELDQGHGIGDTHGIAAYPNGESYKLGFDYPYARLQRYFVRQTFDLGGESQKVEADTNVFEGTTTADRVVLTVGKFAIVDIFDTNKYANNPKTDFMNWALINAGTFDYAGDAWGFTYGAAAEWYTGRWTLRGGVFDLSATPAGGDSPNSYGVDTTFKQLEYVGEIEERHELWGQEGKAKVTAFVAVGRAGLFKDAINPAILDEYGYAAIEAVRTHYNARPGVSVNFEQAVTKDVGIFFRAGWADGSVEPWDFTDIDQTAQLGVSIAGTQWGRPDDRIGVAGIISNIEGIHQQFFNNGGIGILIGDGILPRPTVEKVIEAYYSYALTASTKLSIDYAHIQDPAYNSDRGPVDTIAGRFHWQF